MFEHTHPLKLIDLWLKQLQLEEKYEEEGEEEDENESIPEQDFRCSCLRCGEEINWFHRYYYTCSQCDHFIHKFCAELPERLEDTYHPHTLYFLSHKGNWLCNICLGSHMRDDPSYYCSECDFDVDVKCATKMSQKNIIYHPSHTHQLVCMAKEITCLCDACGKKHEGTFYYCPLCSGPFIHNQCAFLPKKLQIQHNTDNCYSHIHPLDLSYSFPITDQNSKFNPLCRVCRQDFCFTSFWIYKCEKCRYYTHLNCATSRDEPFMSILTSPGTGNIKKNYKDADHPNLVHLPFLDPSYSLLKHLFFNENGSNVLKIKDATKIHPHQLVLKDVGCSTDHMNTSPSSNSRIISSYHDPMKKIELLCDACIRPIMNGPIYVCAGEEKEHCNFVLHEWCSRLPPELKDHPDHPQHTLVLRSEFSHEVFFCHICLLECNGFAYSCKDGCYYKIDVNCAFIPEEITHTCHPNHLLSRVILKVDYVHSCSMCHDYFSLGYGFSCHTCDFHLHAACALLIPKTTTIKLDKHPMELSYLPIENHESEYFCEVCEEELNPER